MTPVYSSSQTQVIIGLGNPGPRYAQTRHNAGFLLLDYLVAQYGGSWRTKGIAQEALITVPTAEGSLQSIRLVKPQTFMNDSGKVAALLCREGIALERMVVVHDELEKGFGSVTLRFGGSARGHNGLRSIMALAGEGFWRLRIGIGRPEGPEAVADFVLRSFLPGELAQFDQVCTQAAQMILRS